MNAIKPDLNMAEYAITLVLIVVLALGVLKSKSAVKDNTTTLGTTAQIAEDNKSALEDIDTTLDARMQVANRLLQARLNSLQSQNLKFQQQVAALEKKLEDPSQASGDLKWIINPVTRHRYSVTPYPLPWHYAKQYAEKNGVKLVVIEDEAENEWLVKTFGADTEYWIGFTDEVEEGKWLWVNGLGAEYSNWAKPEPDNYRKNQHYGIINSKAPHLNQNDPGKWNDVPGNEIRLGIVEQTIPTRTPTTRTRILP